jgi:hypothetical protein
MDITRYFVSRTFSVCPSSLSLSYAYPLSLSHSLSLTLSLSLSHTRPTLYIQSVCASQLIIYHTPPYAHTYTRTYVHTMYIHTHTIIRNFCLLVQFDAPPPSIMNPHLCDQALRNPTLFYPILSYFALSYSNPILSYPKQFNFTHSNTLSSCL